jgi:recombination associated protein RdgC
MWFKNLQVYKFDSEFEFDFTLLNQAMEHKRFQACPKIMPRSDGWVSPVNYPSGDVLGWDAQGVIVISLQTEVKLIPAGVIREQVQARVKKLETQQDRKLSSKERLSIKDEVYGDLLPRAFSRVTRVNAFIDPHNRWLIIDAPTKNKAEEFCSHLRHAWGSLPVKSPIDVPVEQVITRWLRQPSVSSAPFSIGDKCVLNRVEECGSVRCDRIDIESDKILNFLREGATVTQLKLQYKDDLAFTIKDDFSITGLKYSDLLQEQAHEAKTPISHEAVDVTDLASLVITIESVRRLLKDLLPYFTKGD